MLTGSRQEVNQATNVLVAKRLIWIAILGTPLSMVSCYGGVVGGGILIMQSGFFLKLFGGIVVLLGLGSIFFINPIARLFFKGTAQRQIDEVMAMEQNAVARAIELAGAPSYYYAAAGLYGGAIAVNPAAKRIGIVSGRMQYGAAPQTKSIALSAADLVSWSAFKPGLTTEITGSRASAGEMIGSHYRNLSNIVHQSRDTGLTIHTNNIHEPELFVNFDYEAAKRWVLIFDKLSDGSLDVPSESLAYPSVST